MFKVGFYLSNKRDISSIDAIVRIHGERYKYPAGISVNAKYWNPKTHRAREIREYKDAIIINARLSTIENAIRNIAEQYISRAIIPSGKEFVQSVDNYLNPKNVVTVNESEYFTDFINKYYPTLSRAKNTVKRYVTTYNNLTEFETWRRRRIKFSDINMSFYNDLSRWCASKGYSLNYYGDMIKNVKVFYNAAFNNGLHDNKLPGSFTVINSDVDAIYLTVDELMKLHTLSITDDLVSSHFDKILNVVGNTERSIISLMDCRDRFLIGAFTAMRFSDYSTLKGLTDKDEYITRISEKTGIKTIIPMHPVIREILIRRNNILPPAISNQKMNKQLKVLGELAGITDDVEITTTKVTGKIRGIFKKYELITTHTARRSGCTNMYLSGIDVIDIMSFSGHKTTKSFMKYIKASQQQIAEKVKDHPFFK